MGKRIGNALELPLLTAGSNPSTGFMHLYFKSDGKLYKRTNAGVETEVVGGTGGGAVAVQTEPPAGPVLGQQWYDTDDESFSGTVQYIPLDAVLVGAVNTDYPAYTHYFGFAVVGNGWPVTGMVTGWRGLNTHVQRMQTTTGSYERAWNQSLLAWGAWQQIGGLATDWVEVTLINNYAVSAAGASASPPQYRRDSAGNVHIRGNIGIGTAANGASAFTLPPGFRPLDYEHRFTNDSAPVSTSSMRVVVTTGGAVTCYYKADSVPVTTFYLNTIFSAL